MEQAHSILSSFTGNGTTAGEFIILLLQTVVSYQASYAEAIESIQMKGREILEVLQRIPGIKEVAMTHVVETT